MNRTAAGIAMGVALVAASGISRAQEADKGWYVGVSAGQSRVEFEPLVVTGATATSSTSDERDTGAKIFAGYQFNRNFALEGGWMRLGDFRTTTNVTAPVVGSASASVKMDGWHVDAVGIIPFDNGFSLRGRAGVMYSSTRTQLTSAGAVAFAAGTAIDPKRRESNFKWGVGLGYEINKNVGLRVEYDQVKDVGNATTGEGDVGMWTAGFVLKF